MAHPRTLAINYHHQYIVVFWFLLSRSLSTMKTTLQQPQKAFFATSFQYDEPTTYLISIQFQFLSIIYWHKWCSVLCVRTASSRYSLEWPMCHIMYVILFTWFMWNAHVFLVFLCCLLWWRWPPSDRIIIVIALCSSSAI